jgi:hypothetical protein
MNRMLPDWVRRANINRNSPSGPNYFSLYFSTLIHKVTKINIGLTHTWRKDFHILKKFWAFWLVPHTPFVYKDFRTKILPVYRDYRDGFLQSKKIGIKKQMDDCNTSFSNPVKSPLFCYCLLGDWLSCRRFWFVLVNNRRFGFDLLVL